MSKINCSSLLSVSALVLGLAVSASANTVTVSAGPFSPVAGTSTTSFDNGLLPANYVATGSKAGVVSGSLLNSYAQPTADNTPYAYVGTNSSITIGYASGINSFGLYWGSIDSYNGISFTDVNNVVTSYGFNGMSLAGMLPLDTNTSAFVTFLNSGAAWKSVKLTSGSEAFEFDNIATSTPEPASMTLIAGGFAALAAGAIRRRKSSK